ncbi:uncharacterized protein EAF02_010195 [Botrytis sinoallii]|uniref:uncharacterized protein n=1 Tax=Botrytis sinoallii TaxID=1463999 RepID=UPI0018FF5841|nr:uncharacterized protein EAF02_010195 [Botrytis sinoallii]KAF7864227.1 hypothetical protein EAF02_010195 [Botrytis sinoallii]
MNSKGFGVRFFMTALGTGTNLLWSRVDDDFRKIDPYHQLLRGNAKPQKSHLSSRAYESLFSPHSFHRKKTLSRLLDFILFDPLRVSTDNPSKYTIRSRHGVKSLPKKPCTIAARLEYLDPTGEVDDSNLLRILDGLASLEREERDARIISRVKLYSMGIGEDGKLRIDEDERTVGK